jgi:hypothetical protein
VVIFVSDTTCSGSWTGVKPTGANGTLRLIGDVCRHLEDARDGGTDAMYSVDSQTKGSSGARLMISLVMGPKDVALRRP